MGATSSTCSKDLLGDGFNFECCMPSNGNPTIVVKAEASERKEKASKGGQAKTVRRASTESNIAAFASAPRLNPDDPHSSPKQRNSLSSSEQDTSSPPSDSPAKTSDTPPLPGWTQKEQSVLMSELKADPQARKNPETLQLLFERTHRIIPNKSLEEIEVCYNYLESKKIAFFGSKNSNALRRHASFRNS
jgi:hypothetical protein